MCAYIITCVQVCVGEWHQEDAFLSLKLDQLPKIAVWQPVAPSSAILGIALYVNLGALFKSRALGHLGKASTNVLVHGDRSGPERDGGHR